MVGLGVCKDWYHRKYSHQYFRCIKETNVACRSFLELVDRRRTDKRGAFISKGMARIFPARWQHQSCVRGPSWFLNIHPVERGHGFTTEEKEMRKQNLFETCWRWWLSWVHDISMDKESAEVHAVKAGGTVLHWVRKTRCPQYSWEILCAAKAGESWMVRTEVIAVWRRTYRQGAVMMLICELWWSLGGFPGRELQELIKQGWRK